MSAPGDHTTTRVLHTCRPILHFFCRGLKWSSTHKRAIPIFSFWGRWMNPNPIFFPFAHPSLTYPPNDDFDLPTYLPTSFYTPSHLLPTYQSPTYLFPCNPSSLLHLPNFSCFFLFCVNKLATPCSLMLLRCFIYLFFKFVCFLDKLWVASCFLFKEIFFDLCFVSWQACSFAV